jgi:sialate O-acetylesterase
VLLVLTPAAVAGPSISISSPRAYQVVQRDSGGRAGIIVSGRRHGFAGPVQVRWGEGPWTTVAVAGDRFRVRLAPRPAGQATLTVRSARQHGVACSRECVGIGDIYVIAGQSNAGGRSRTLFSYAHPSLRAALFGNDDRWCELSDPTDSAEGQVDRISRDLGAGGSVWPLVATSLMAAEPVPVAFVPCARIGTPIAHWQRRVSRPRAASTLYGSMLRRVRAVGGRVRAVLLWQGEADARHQRPGEVYEAALRRFAADVRRDCGAPVVVAQIGDFGAHAFPAAGVDAIRLAQQRAWRRAAIVAGPVLYDIDLDDSVHFDAPDDVGTAARRWAAAILGGVLGRAAGSPPRLVRATYDGELTVSLGVAAGSRPLAPGVVGGFVVRSAGLEVPLAGAAVSAPDAVTLTLVEPASGPLTVTLGSGRTAAGSPVPAESSAWRLPMLMFVERPVAGPLD